MECLFDIKAVAAAVSGDIKNCNADALVASVSTDTRTILDGAVFVALKGERFDGHGFISKAIEGGAVCCVVNRGGEYGSLPVIEVDDTSKALMDLARCYRKKFDIPTIGITGSVGKTSTKEMIASVLSQSYKTHVTKGNFNNMIGLPLTVFDLSKNDDIMVLEMGMSAFGEISALTRIALPDTAVITNIGLSHIEHLGSREGIRKAKLEILEGLQPDGTVILNGDDALLWEYRGNIDYETLYYGINNKNCDLTAYDVRMYSDGSEFSCRIDGDEYRFALSVPGEHHIYNALAAILTGLKYNIDIEDIKTGVRNFAPSGLRQTVIRLTDYTVIRDCYNASPASMKSGLEVLALTAGKGKKTACLADMLELGEISEEAHKAVGRLVAEYKTDRLITVGTMAHYIARGAEEAGMPSENIFEFENNEEATKNLPNVLENGDIILVKGSRGMKLEEIADAITRLSGN